MVDTTGGAGLGLKHSVLRKGDVSRLSCLLQATKAGVFPHLQIANHSFPFRDVSAFTQCLDPIVVESSTSGCVSGGGSQSTGLSRILSLRSRNYTGFSSRCTTKKVVGILRWDSKDSCHRLRSLLADRFVRRTENTKFSRPVSTDKLKESVEHEKKSPSLSKSTDKIDKSKSSEKHTFSLENSFQNESDR